MQYLFRPENWTEWSKLAVEKINKVIDSCESKEHLDIARTMISNYVFITALEDGTDEKTLEDIMELFWFKLDLKSKLISQKSETKETQLV